MSLGRDARQGSPKGDEHKTQRMAMLDLLMAGGEPTNVDLLRTGGLKYSARLDELRKLGHTVKCLPPRKGEGRLYRYRWMGQDTMGPLPQTRTTAPAAGFWLGPESGFQMFVPGRAK